MSPASSANAEITKYLKFLLRDVSSVISICFLDVGIFMTLKLTYLHLDSSCGGLVIALSTIVIVNNIMKNCRVFTTTSPAIFDVVDMGGN